LIYQSLKGYRLLKTGSLAVPLAHAFDFHREPPDTVVTVHPPNYSLNLPSWVKLRRGTITPGQIGNLCSEIDGIKKPFHFCEGYERVSVFPGVVSPLLFLTTFASKCQYLVLNTTKEQIILIPTKLLFLCLDMSGRTLAIFKANVLIFLFASADGSNPASRRNTASK